MHMADGLLSPAVGATMWAVTSGLVVYCSKKINTNFEEKKIPLMGVLGAFIFAAQMINFTIPGTGSSGHLGGGMVLAILLGPHAAFLTIASVLTIQALFFADGGLLALGCNIFNLGFFPAYVGYPFIYKIIVDTNNFSLNLKSKESSIYSETSRFELMGSNRVEKQMAVGAIVASIVCLQLGALSVVFETSRSGISALPFYSFLTLMLPIHLGIGLVEGLVTAAIIIFVYRSRPEVLEWRGNLLKNQRRPLRNLMAFFLVAALLLGGIFSSFVSENPDGLEWAVQKIVGENEFVGPTSQWHSLLSKKQEEWSFLPDYDFKKEEPSALSSVVDQSYQRVEVKSSLNKGASYSGLIGGILTLIVTAGLGLLLKKIFPKQIR